MVVPVDRLSSLLERFSVRAHLFHNGPLCGVTHFDAQPGRAFLHVLRRGEMIVKHRPKAGPPRRVVVSEPSLVFYPRPLSHDFHNAPAEGSDFTCASLEFDGGVSHPLARALPPMVLVALHRVEGLDQSLALLFAETDRVRCGHRLLADRLFEVVLLQLLRWLLDHPEEGGVPVGLLAGLADPRLAQALVAMHEDPAKPWSLEGMARTAGMSRSAFAAKFKGTVGETPADYLANWRLSVAKIELRNGRSIKSLASALGYATPSALSRVFAHKLGVSPRRWLAESSSAEEARSPSPGSMAHLDGSASSRNVSSTRRTGAALASGKKSAQIGSGVPRPSQFSTRLGVRDGQKHLPDKVHTPAEQRMVE